MTRASAAVYPCFWLTARTWADQIDLLTESEYWALFPGGELRVERFFLWPKSYMVTWFQGSESAQFGTRSCEGRTIASAARIPRSRPAPWGTNGRYRSEPDH